jgi:1-phosphofructokinase family hexose kinase
MIYTITPNPALDLSGVVDELVPNEKAYVHQEVWSPGGNAINAARIIQALKAPVTASGFLGGGIGAEVENLLNQEKVKNQFIKIKGMTRVNVTVSSLEDHLQTRLSFAGPTILKSEKNQLNDWISRIRPPALLVIGGKLPQGMSPSDICRWIQVAKKQGIETMVDMPGAILKGIYKARPLFIKPNLVEFQEFLGKKMSSIPEVLKEVKKLNREIPLICISSVKGGALLVSSTGAWFGEIPKVKVRTTVGAGDSMVGAMAAYFWKSWVSKNKRWNNVSDDFLAQLLGWGLAAACATLTLPGLSLGEGRQIRSYFPKIRVRRID